MSRESAEQLENIISAYINTIYKDVPPTAEEFREKAVFIRDNSRAIASVSDEEFSGILSRLRQALTIQLGVGEYENTVNCTYRRIII